jgi:hypothetical protein
MGTGFDTKTFLIGFLISIVGGIISYIVSLKNEQKAVVLGNTIIVTLLGASISLFLSAINETKKAFANAIPTIRTETLQGLSRDIYNLDKEIQSTPEYSEIHEIILEPLRLKLSKNILEARNGIIELTSIEDTINIASALINRARDNVFVTSYINPSQWWQSNPGTQYQQNISSVPKRIKGFIRIFIVDSDSELIGLKPIMTAQKSDLIKIKYALSKNLDPALRRDILIIDSKVASELMLDQARNFKSALFFPSNRKAEDYLNIFRQINLNAIEIK